MCSPLNITPLTIRAIPLFSQLNCPRSVTSAQAMSKMNGTIFTIGSGPGIGRAVTSLFALKGCYQNVALFARRSDQLAVEKSALEETVGTGLRVKIFTVDITDTDAFSKALGDAEVEFGKPDLVFFNAARVLPSQLLTHDVKEIEIDFKVISMQSNLGGTSSIH